MQDTIKCSFCMSVFIGHRCPYCGRHVDEDGEEIIDEGYYEEDE